MTMKALHFFSGLSVKWIFTRRNEIITSLCFVVCLSINEITHIKSVGFTVTLYYSLGEGVYCSAPGGVNPRNSSGNKKNTYISYAIIREWRTGEINALGSQHICRIEDKDREKFIWDPVDNTQPRGWTTLIRRGTPWEITVQKAWHGHFSLGKSRNE